MHWLGLYLLARFHFVVNGAKETVSFPFEYYPLPKKGDRVDCVDREGNMVVQGKVLKIINPPKYDATVVITVEVPMEHIKKVRSIKRLGRSE